MGKSPPPYRRRGGRRQLGGKEKRTGGRGASASLSQHKIAHHIKGRGKKGNRDCPLVRPQEKEKKYGEKKGPDPHAPWTKALLKPSKDDCNLQKRGGAKGKGVLRSLLLKSRDW